VTVAQRTQAFLVRTVLSTSLLRFPPSVCTLQPPAAGRMQHLPPSHSCHVAHCPRHFLLLCCCRLLLFALLPLAHLVAQLLGVVAWCLLVPLTQHAPLRAFLPFCMARRFCCIATRAGRLPGIWRSSAVAGNTGLLSDAGHFQTPVYRRVSSVADGVAQTTCSSFVLPSPFLLRAWRSFAASIASVSPHVRSILQNAIGRGASSRIYGCADRISIAAAFLRMFGQLRLLFIFLLPSFALHDTTRQAWAARGFMQRVPGVLALLAKERKEEHASSTRAMAWHGRYRGASLRTRVSPAENVSGVAVTSWPRYTCLTFFPPSGLHLVYRAHSSRFAIIRCVLLIPLTFCRLQLSCRFMHAMCHGAAGVWLAAATYYRLVCRHCWHAAFYFSCVPIAGDGACAAVALLTAVLPAAPDAAAPPLRGATPALRQAGGQARATLFCASAPRGGRVDAGERCTGLRWQTWRFPASPG